MGKKQHQALLCLCVYARLIYFGARHHLLVFFFCFDGPTGVTQRRKDTQGLFCFHFRLVAPTFHLRCKLSIFIAKRVQQSSSLKLVVYTRVTAFHRGQAIPKKKLLLRDSNPRPVLSQGYKENIFKQGVTYTLFNRLFGVYPVSTLRGILRGAGGMSR